MPYKNSSMSMVIFLPRNCSHYYSFNNNFGNFDFTQLHKQLFYREVLVSIPKFMIDFELPNMKTELTQVL